MDNTRIFTRLMLTIWFYFDKHSSLNTIKRHMAIPHRRMGMHRKRLWMLVTLLERLIVRRSLQCETSLCQQLDNSFRIRNHITFTTFATHTFYRGHHLHSNTSHMHHLLDHLTSLRIICYRDKLSSRDNLSSRVSLSSRNSLNNRDCLNSQVNPNSRANHNNKGNRRFSIASIRINRIRTFRLPLQAITMLRMEALMAFSTLS